MMLMVLVVILAGTTLNGVKDRTAAEAREREAQARAQTRQHHQPRRQLRNMATGAPHKPAVGYGEPALPSQ